MPSFSRHSNSPKQPSGSSGNLFGFSFGDSSKMASFQSSANHHRSNSSSQPFRFSSTASDRDPSSKDTSARAEHHRGSDRSVRELGRYLTLLNPNRSSQQRDPTTADGLHVEELLTTPLFSWTVKLALADLRKRGRAPDEAHFDQFALLGQERSSPYSSNHLSSPVNPAGVEPIFLNTNAPWSAFLCGSQGSGKSHTLACMLEGCLLPSKALGRLPEPLQGVVFHCDAWSAGSVCEAAHLCSVGIDVNVLVSPSNYWRLKSAYSKVPDPKRCLKVRELRLRPKHLNVERMLALMAFNESNGRVPLYMEVINKILRDMATSARGAFSFDYAEFRRRLDSERLTPDQKGPMNLRLQLLESFMDVDDVDTSTTANKRKTKENSNADDDDDGDDIFSPAPGSLTIVDLTDPFIDASSACTLFDICLALFLETSPEAGAGGGRIVALDEAHKYMTGTAASDRFTDSLLTTIRIQRHAATRVVVATQEPTISPKLLDLCSMTIVHRFTSPAWLAVLREHLAGLAAVAGKTDADVRALFEEIVTLKVGESLLFAPSGVVSVVVDDDDDDDDDDGGDGNGRGRGAGRIVKLGTECVRFKTRPRLTNDGGKSVLAIR